MLFAKITGQRWGRGQAKIKFSRDFDKIEPEDQKAILNQIALQIRDAHKTAERNHRIKLQREDLANAEAIRAATT